MPPVCSKKNDEKLSIGNSNWSIFNSCS